MTRKLSRKEIKKDPFVTVILNTWEYVREHQGTVFAGLIIVLVLIAGGLWMRNARRGGRPCLENRRAAPTILLAARPAPLARRAAADKQIENVGKRE